MSWLSRAAGFVSGVFAVVRHVAISEVGEAAAAAKRLYDRCESCNWSADDEVAAVVDAGVVALKEAADVTQTQIDDDIADAIGSLATVNRQWLVDAIQFCIANEAELSAATDNSPMANVSAFAAIKPPPNAAGGPLVWIELAALIWGLIKPFIRK